MEYQFRLADIADIYSPGAAQAQALLAIAERLERIVELLEKEKEPNISLPEPKVDCIMACYSENRPFGNNLCSHFPCAIRRLAIAQDA